MANYKRTVKVVITHDSYGDIGLIPFQQNQKELLKYGQKCANNVKLGVEMGPEIFKNFFPNFQLPNKLEAVECHLTLEEKAH